MRCAAWGVALLATVAGAQESVFAGDPLDVEIAARKLRMMPVEELPRAALERALAAPRAAERAAAASVLIAHGLADDALRARFAVEPEPAIRAILVAAADDDACRAAVADDDDVVAAAALWALAGRDALDDATLIAALWRAPGVAIDAVVEIVVTFSSPLRLEVLNASVEHPAARAAMLERLQSRPRKAALPWLRRQLEVSDDQPIGRLLIYAAHPVGALSLDDGRDLVEIAGALGGHKYGAVMAAADRLPPEVADRLVGAVHRVMAAGLNLDGALDVLKRVTASGERQIASMFQATTPAEGELLTEWLARRDSSLLVELVREGLTAEEPCPPYLLRRARDFIASDDVIRNRVRARLGSSDPEESAAAFFALTEASVYEPAMLDYVLEGEDERDVLRRLRRLFDVPHQRVPSATWRELLAHDFASVRALTLALLSTVDSLVFDFEDEIFRLAVHDPEVRVEAARLLLARGRSGAVEDLWARLDAGERTAVVASLRGRDEPWVRALLDADAERETPEFGYVRFCLGDPTVRDQLIDDPQRWPLPLVRRVGDTLAASLELADVARLRPHCFGESRLRSGYRTEIVGWLARRPELRAPWLVELRATDPDLEVQERALEALLERPVGQTIRERISAGIGAPFDEDLDDERHAVVGALRAPLSPGDAALLARLLLVAPLGQPRDEVEEHLGLDAGDATPGVVMTAMAVQAVRGAELGPDTVRAFAAAAAEARAHPAAWALSRARLGGLLTEFSRYASARQALAPIVARLLLEAADADPTWTGPAHLVLAGAAEDAGQLEEAAAAYARAALALAATPPPPPSLRVFLDDDDPTIARIGTAWLTARPWICRARAAGEPDARRRHLVRAMDLADGDRATESEVSALLEETPR